MTRKEIPGKPPEPDCDRVDELVAHWARQCPQRPALCEAGEVWSYARLAGQVEEATRFLAGEGVGPGERVLILMENGIAGVALILAAMRLGAWAVPVNARLSRREVSEIRAHAAPRVTCYSLRSSPDARAHAEADGAAGHPALEAVGAAFRSEPGPQRGPEPEEASGRERVAALIYTSGTTGAPKGVMLSHGNLLFVAERTARIRQLGEDDRVYLVLPISHVFGLAAVLICNLFRGVRVDLAARFSPDAVAKALAEDGVTALHGVPPMYSQLLSLARQRGGRLAAPRLRYLSVGGAPLDLALKRAVEAQFGVTLYNGYGLTETSPTVSTTSIGDGRDDDSVGTLLPDVEIRIVGPDGGALAQGEVGELWVRGGLVMKGYYRDPAATAAVLGPDHWLKTGDLARHTADGNLYIVGRSKDVIIRSGFNVYPVEVEGVIASHPGIALVAVIGRRRGDNEEVVAFVQPRPGRAPEAAELAALAARHLAPYKRPSCYLFRDSLPITGAGKVLRRELQRELQDELSGEPR